MTEVSASLEKRRAALQQRRVQGLWAREADPNRVQRSRFGYDKFAKKDKYEKADDGTTRCSEFVRDVAAHVAGKDIPELKGQAKDQYEAMAKAADGLGGPWQRLRFQADPEAAFRTAHALAAKGHLVVAAWRNPDAASDPTNTGHVALVVPDGGLVASGAWGMDVPHTELH